MTVRSSTAFYKKFMWKFLYKKFMFARKFHTKFMWMLNFLRWTLTHIDCVLEISLHYLANAKMQKIIYFQSLMGKNLNETGLST